MVPADPLTRAGALVPALEVAAARPLTSGSTGHTWQVPLRTGGSAVVKAGAGPGVTAQEAAGLRWLNDAGMPIPAVLACTAEVLVLEWVSTTRPSETAALRFGTDLARMHRTPAPAFGVAPGDSGDPACVWVGAVQVPAVARANWPQHYISDRLRPTTERAERQGTLAEADADAVAMLCQRLLADPTAVAGPPVDPARLHGDLWSGNLLWESERVRVIDPSACGGHPETDLAMLYLFGAPHLDVVTAAYAETGQLHPDWQRRIPLHQVFPLLVHAVMFGGGYGSQAGAAARRALAVSSRGE